MLKQNRKNIPIMPPDLALLSTLIGSNYPCRELIFMVPKVFEPLKFYCTYIGIIIRHFHKWKHFLWIPVCFPRKTNFFLKHGLLLHYGKGKLKAQDVCAVSRKKRGRGGGGGGGRTACDGDKRCSTKTQVLVLLPLKAKFIYTFYRGSSVHSISSSPFHRLKITKLLLKGKLKRRPLSQRLEVALRGQILSFKS